jgi:hypothetical protein
MHLRTLIALSLAAFVFTACSQEAPTVGEAKDFASVCDRANDGKRVSVQGYLILPESFTGDDSVVLRLHETDAFGGTPVGVQINFGTGANQVEMVPTEYSDDDLKVHLSDGRVVGFGEKVKVSGKVYFPVVDQDFDCGLENVLVEAGN